MQQNEEIAHKQSSKWFSIGGGLIMIFLTYILFFKNTTQHPINPPSAPAQITKTTPPVQTSLTSVVPMIKFSEIPTIRFSNIPMVIFSELPAIAKPFAAQPEFFSEPSADETSQAISAAHAEYARNDFHPVVDTVIVMPKLNSQSVTKEKSTQGSLIPSVQLNTAAKTRNISHKSDSLYTIQLIAFMKQSSVAKFAEQHHLLNNIQQRRSMTNGKLWYVLTYGNYKTYREAEQAISKLPDDVKKSGPWPKKIASYVK